MKKTKALKRKKRARSKISGSAKRPRISVFRSNRNLFVQLIDDTKGKTILSFSQKSLPKAKLKSKTKTQIATLVGEEIGKKARAKKIKTAVFDKGHYKYHGRVKALAEAIRKAGVKF